MVAEQKIPDRVVIPFNVLDERLQDNVMNVRFQRFGRLAGLVFYPTVSLAGLLSKNPVLVSMLTLTPFCVGLHQMGTVFSSDAAKEVLTKGIIVNKGYEKPEWRLDFLRKNFTHFYIKRNGDLVFVKEPRKGFFKRLFSKRRITLEEGAAKDSKARKLVRDLLGNSIRQDKIAYHHLDPEIRAQVAKLIQARRKRFKRVMSMVVAGPALGSMHSQDIKQLLSFAGIGGLIGLIVSGREAGHETDKLWRIIEKKGHLIAPEFRDKYNLEKVRKEKPYFKVTFFGNIKPVKKRWLALRRTHRL